MSTERFHPGLVAGQIPTSEVRQLADESQDQQGRQARHLNQVELAAKAAQAPETPEPQAILVTTYASDPYIAELARRRAAGHCQLCGNAAPFRAKGGRPFLEVHHVLWLSRGGPDTLANTAALCPNCHRRVHVLDLEADRTLLMLALQESTQPKPSEPLSPPAATDAEVEEFYEALAAEAQSQALPTRCGKPEDGLLL